MDYRDTAKDKDTNHNLIAYNYSKWERMNVKVYFIELYGGIKCPFHADPSKF